MPSGPPPLPADTPPEVRRFVDGEIDALELADGPAAWLPVPDAVRRLGPLVPRVRITPARGTDHRATLRAGWGPFSLGLDLEVREGRLHAHVGGFGPLTRDLRSGVNMWVASVNAWLAVSRRLLTPLAVSPGRLVLRTTEADAARSDVPDESDGSV